MGSGVLLAILVALWFIVLVPMVVTRGDLATAPAEPVRVLRRRSDRSSMSSSATSSASSSARSSHGQASPGQASRGQYDRRQPSRPKPDQRGDRVVGVENLRTEPIPQLPRRVPGATLLAEQPPVPERRAPQAPAGNRVVADPPVRDEPKPTRAEADIRTRRRRMLTGMFAFAGLWALFAAFWQPVLWWPQIVLDLIIFSYLVFLRMEAQREQDRQERRRARAAARVSMPEDRTERLVRRRSQYQAQVTAATEHHAIALDDDDPSFTEMPTWQPTAPADPPVDDATYWSSRKAV